MTRYGLGCGRQCLFDQAKEKFAPALRFSPIESECEFVEVVHQMRVADRALVGSEQPAFQQRNDSMHAGQQFARVLEMPT